MNSKLAAIFLIFSITLVTFAGCGRTQDVTTDTIPNDTQDEAAASRVKIVWLLDYPEGGKTVYTVWEESVASTLNLTKCL